MTIKVNIGRAQRGDRSIKSSRLIFILAITAYLFLVGFDSLLRFRTFSVDSMFYVEMARNVVAGDGLTTRTYEVRDLVNYANPPQSIPVVHWPPLYPLAIAGLACLGISAPNAALIVSFGFGCAALLAAHRITSRAYGAPTADFVTGYLAVFGDLYFEMTTAWSETMAITFCLVALYFLMQTRDTPRQRVFAPLFAGVSTGLAFDTRYAMLPLAIIGALTLLERTRVRRSATNVLLFAAGLAIAAAPVILRNIAVSGAALHYVAGAPNRSLLANVTALGDAVVAGVFQSPLGLILKTIQWPLLAVLLLIIVLACAIPRYRHTATYAFRCHFLPAFFNGQTRVLTIWGLAYTAFLLVYATYHHLDPLEDGRLTSPGIVVLTIPVLAFLVRALKLPPRIVIRSAIVILSFATMMLALVAVGRPHAESSESILRQSQTKSWLIDNATPRDLIIGDNVARLRFAYPERNAALYFVSNVPEEHLTVDQFNIAVEKLCGRYEHTYLAVTFWSLSGGSIPPDFRATHGDFIADLVEGLGKEYRAIALKKKFNDGFVFEVACPQKAASISK